MQSQEDEEVIQDVVTQEPTSLEIAAGIPRFQLEDDPGMDIIPDTQGSEDEQTIASGDTEILEEELYDGEDIQSQGQENKDVAVTQEPATQTLNSEMQEEDTVTQELVSPKAINVSTEENPGGAAVTQEPATQEENSEI